MHIPDLVIHQIIRSLAQSEKLKLRFLNLQWKNQIDDSLDLTYKYKNRSCLNKEKLLLKKMGKYHTALDFSYYQEGLDECIKLHCTRITKAMDLYIPINRENFTKGNEVNLINQLQVKELMLKCSDITDVLNLKMGDWLHNLNINIAIFEAPGTIQVLNQLYSASVSSLYLTTRVATNRMIQAIEENFPNITSLKIYFLIDYEGDFTPGGSIIDPFIPTEVDKNLCVLPKLKRLKSAHLDFHRYVTKVTLPSASSLPKLEKLVILQSRGLIIKGPDMVYHTIKELKIEAIESSWRGVSYHFPNLETLSFVGDGSSNILAGLSERLCNSLYHLTLYHNQIKPIIDSGLKLNNLGVLDIHIDSFMVQIFYKFCHENFPSLVTLNINSIFVSGNNTQTASTGTEKSSLTDCTSPNIMVPSVKTITLRRCYRTELTGILRQFSELFPNLERLYIFDATVNNDLFMESDFILPNLSSLWTNCASTYLFYHRLLTKVAPRLQFLSKYSNERTIRDLNKDLGPDRKILANLVVSD